VPLEVGEPVTFAAPALHVRVGKSLQRPLAGVVLISLNSVSALAKAAKFIVDRGASIVSTFLLARRSNPRK